MAQPLTLIFHHGGIFVKEPTLEYLEGEEDAWDDLDVDYISIPVIHQMYKEHGYHEYKRCFWLVPGFELEKGLRPLVGDRDIIQLYQAIDQTNKIHIYFEHNVDVPNIIPPELPLVWQEDQCEEPANMADECPVDEPVHIADECLVDEPMDIADECLADECDNDIAEENMAAQNMDDVGLDERQRKGKGPARTVKQHARRKKQQNIFNIGIDSLHTSGVVVSSDDDDERYKSEELGSLVCSDEDDTGEGSTKYPTFMPNVEFGKVEIELGMEFPTLQVFKSALQNYSIALGREFRYVKNDKVRVRSRCSIDHCEWEVFYSWSNETNSFQVKTFNNEHSCARGFKNRKANKKWLANELVPVIRAHPAMKHVEALDWFKQNRKVVIDDFQIYRALKMARYMVEGSEKEQYAALWDYCEELKRTNLGSSIFLKVNRSDLNQSPIFNRLYICLEACKRGFKNGCRPLIGLDGCFLKGYYGGQLLAVCSMDGNNSFFVIAYAFVNTESKDTWKWFLELLLEDIGNYREHGWNFITDQQKGLLPAMHELIPGVHHKFCARHLWTNFHKQWKNANMRNLLWECVSSSTTNSFTRNMERMKAMDEKTWAFLNRHSASSWSKSGYSHFSKNDSTLNNACEQFNNCIEKFRSKPIITMAEELRLYLVRKMNKERAKAARCNGPICPKAQDRLEIAKRESFKWTPHWVGDPDGYKFEVESRPLKVAVDLGSGTCSCNLWQLSGIPCKHVIACMAHNNLKPEDYVDSYYSVETWRKVYEPYIQPTAGPEHWRKTRYLPILPPPFKRQPGRPKKHRRKDKEVEVNPHKLRRKYGNTKCSKCSVTGHNIRSCKCRPVEQVEGPQSQSGREGEVANRHTPSIMPSRPAKRLRRVEQVGGTSSGAN